MPKQSKAEQLAALQKKEAELKARKKVLKSKISSEERKQDTRRKIIVGSVLIAHAEKNAEFAGWLAKFLNRALTKSQDRTLLADLLSIPIHVPQMGANSDQTTHGYQQVAADTTTDNQPQQYSAATDQPIYK